MAAGLACRVCLSGDVAWSLAAEPWDPVAHCRCRGCGHERTVALTGDQALRLSLAGEHGEEAASAPRYGLALVV